MSVPLTEAEITAAREELPGWTFDAGWLTRTRTLETFLAALDWVQQVGRLAETMDHHPDIDLRWRTVTLRIRTHEAGDRITAADVEFARRVGVISTTP